MTTGMTNLSASGGRMRIARRGVGSGRTGTSTAGGKGARVKLPKQVQVKLTIPFVGEVSGTWEPDQAERHAAWELYVELVTRVAVVELGPEEGLLREALSSLHALCEVAEILR
jgi:hypothetical protein